jgi:hypothetical protein
LWESLVHPNRARAATTDAISAQRFHAVMPPPALFRGRVSVGSAEYFLDENISPGGGRVGEASEGLRARRRSEARRNAPVKGEWGAAGDDERVEADEEDAVDDRVEGLEDVEVGEDERV